jgi:signal transduction histidine kinase
VDPEGDERGTASGRRLARLALDLHDGPLQEIAALAADLRLLRVQTATAPAEVVRGRIDDALAVLGSIETDVRDLARSLESKRVVDAPFLELVMAEAEQAEADGIAMHVSVVGDVQSCTASQRIALYRVVQESLWNARQHSAATSVSVAVSVGTDLLVAEVVDDGRGFDVDAARGEEAGMGLAGMHERVGLLGGDLQVTSGPGGPTTIRATIPCWTPAVKAGPAQAAMPRESA